MDEKKLPVRKKGRAETVIEDLNKYGLILFGISKQDGTEKLIPIDPENPYRAREVFNESDFYRIFTSDGRPVIDKRHLSGIRKWIDNGEIENYKEIAERRKFDKDLAELVKTQLL